MIPSTRIMADSQLVGLSTLPIWTSICMPYVLSLVFVVLPLYDCLNHLLVHHYLQHDYPCCVNHHDHLPAVDANSAILQAIPDPFLSLLNPLHRTRTWSASQIVCSPKGTFQKNPISIFSFPKKPLFFLHNFLSEQHIVWELHSKSNRYLDDYVVQIVSRCY